MHQVSLLCFKMQIAPTGISLFDAIVEGISQDLNDAKRACIRMKWVEKKV
jgi:hypothetical protein